MPPCEVTSSISSSGEGGARSEKQSLKGRPWVVEWERSNMDDITLMDIMETYSDVLEKYGILHLQLLVTKLMGEKALNDTRPEMHWQSWEGARVETITARFPLRYETDLPIKTWRKRNAKASKLLSAEILLDPIATYWRTVERSLLPFMPELEGSVDVNGPILPSTFQPTYGMIMDSAEGMQKGGRGIKEARDVSNAQVPFHWRQHHADFGGSTNLLYHHPDLSNHILLGIASPHSYYYGGGPFSSFQWHWEDFYMPSINFLYSGAEKHWCGAPARDTLAVWKIMQRIGSVLQSRADEKKFLLTPTMLWSLGQIETYPVHQLPGDAVISAAGATHGGCNLGGNFAEAVNFGDEAWRSMVPEMVEFYDERDRSVPQCVLQVAGVE